ncbi:MAG TPA: hypothetical protein VGH42_13890 [Verrucomicrobiae bacterium]|jgi:hypothetical protein
MSDQEDNKQVIADPPKRSANRFGHWCKNFRKEHGDTLWVLSIIGSVIVGTIAANWFYLVPRIDDEAKKVVLSQEVLEDISSRLRPYAVIDVRPNSSSATFEYDEGVGNIVDSVDFHEGEPNLSEILTFKMNRLVKLPLVRPLTAGIYVHSFWPTNKYDWAFEIRHSMTALPMQQGMVSGSMEQDFSTDKDYKFFVELLTK